MMAELVGLGVKGYIPTSASAEVAVGVLRLVCAGGTYVPTSVLRSWTRAASEPATALAAWGRLTPREREVVNYLRRGLPNKLIAHELDMCEGTVKVHVRNVMKKLGVCSRAQFALQALGHADAPGPQGSFP